jgi:hypothetical protein
MIGDTIACIIFVMLAFFLLEAGSIYYLTQNEHQKSYSVSLSGQPTYSNYPMTALVDDSEKINIFGLNLTGNVSITLTDMIGQTGNIESTNIEYKVYPKIMPQNQMEPTKIQLTVTNTNPGVFEGLMMINDSKTASVISIPITLTSDTVINYAVIWILAGVFSSLAFWEFLRIKKYKIANDWLLAKANANALDTIKGQNYERTRDNLEKRYSFSIQGAKVTFLDILSVLFGIAVGFIGLLSNDYLTSIRIITPESMVILFGTGLGIGSIKELLED